MNISHDTTEYPVKVRQVYQCDTSYFTELFVLVFGVLALIILKLLQVW